MLTLLSNRIVFVMIALVFFAAAAYQSEPGGHLAAPTGFTIWEQSAAAFSGPTMPPGPWDEEGPGGESGPKVAKAHVKGEAMLLAGGTGIMRNTRLEKQR